MSTASVGMGTPARPRGRLVMRLFGFLFAGSLLAISATMNWKFGIGLSPDETESHLFGLASLAVDGLKATLPLFIIFLWRARHVTMALVAMCLWGLCFSWSMASAVGFSAKTRAEASAGRTGQIEARAVLSERETEIKAQLASLPAHRSASVVRAELETIDIPVDVWRRTKQCTEITRENSREACQSALLLRRELAAAEEGEKLEAEEQQVRAKLADYLGIVPVADPQVQTLARVTDVPAETVKLALVLLLATLVEVASAFGITVVSLATSKETMLRIEQRRAAGMHHKHVRRQPAVELASAADPAQPLQREPALTPPAPKSQEAAHARQRNGTPVAIPGVNGVVGSVAEVHPQAAQQATARSNGGGQVTGTWVMPNRRW